MAVFALLLLIALSSASRCSAAPQGPARAASAPQRIPVAERITSNLYRVGAALIDMRARTVTCKGAVNMDQGPIEYLAVSPHGKLHESLLRIDVRPIHLQVALLLLGLVPKNVLEYQGEARTPQGDPVTMRVRWSDPDGARHEANAADWIESLPERLSPAGNPWVFTGSRILKEGFEADLSQSLVAVWHDPAAIVDNRSPGGARNGYVVFEGRVPRRGTRVELVIAQAGSGAAVRGQGGGKRP
jgi:hypothetical protein